MSTEPHRTAAVQPEPTDAELRAAYALLQAERPELRPYDQAIACPEVALVVRVVARAIASGRYAQRPAAPRHFPARHRPRQPRGQASTKAPAPRRPDAKQRQAHDVDTEGDE